MSQYDYVVDAIDTVSSKLILIEKAKAFNVPIISCTGMQEINWILPGLKLPDIYETSVCPLAKVMRYELRKRGIESLKWYTSKEPPISPFKRVKKSS